MPKTNAAKARKQEKIKEALTQERIKKLSGWHVTSFLKRATLDPLISCAIHGLSKAVAFESHGYEGFGCDECMKEEHERRSKESQQNTVRAENLLVLRGLHTRELLGWLDKTRKLGGYYSPAYPSGPCYTTLEVKTILEERPHIPNKREAKEIRQAKAQHKRNR